MKPKVSKAKKSASKILKPAVSATAIRKALKSVVDKDLLAKSTGTVKHVRGAKPAASVSRSQPAQGERGKRGVKHKLQLPNDHPVEENGNVEPETSKRQKTTFLEIPKLPRRHGNVFVFGENDTGQLGIPDVPRRTRPTQLQLGVPVVEIAAGGMHSVCLSANGDVFTFGCNDEGALGRPQTDDDSEAPPAVVTLPERIVMISAGDSHTAALSETGKVYLWGNFRNSQGSMGLTSDGRKRTNPIRILENIQVVKIASGAEHVVCLSADGDVYTCGCAESGQLGRITPRSAADGGRTGGLDALLNPDIVRVAGRRRKFDNIWTGSYCTFLREKSSKQIYAFGLNNHNHLGYHHKNREIARYYPKRVPAFQNNTEIISGGQHHTLSLATPGYVYAVGRHEYGRLGLGENMDAMEPTLIPSLANVHCSDISCGNCVSFAISSRDGHVYSWGMGDSYQLGHGNDDDCFIPTVIEGNFGATWHAFRVSGGGQHTLVLAYNRNQ